MASWNQILDEMQATVVRLPNGKIIDNYGKIISKYISNFANLRQRNVIVYYSDWLNQFKRIDIDINDGDIVAFMNASYQLDKSKGLDLIIQTPGGDPQATEGIVKYLHKMFGSDIEIFIPHMAMSAGTMLACSSKCIWMGSHSFLGPIDPQFSGGISAYNIKKEFEDAKDELVKNPETFRNWQIRLSKYQPAFYYTVTDAIDRSSELVKGWLTDYMFFGEDKAKEKAEAVTKKLNVNARSHAKHFDIKDCELMGLKIKRLEDDKNVHEALLNVYYSLQICGANSALSKCVVNQNGKTYVKYGIIQPRENKIWTKDT